jgi:hypothetical protein
MKRFLMLAVPFFSLFFVLAFSAPAQNVPGPKMVMPEKNHDFKEVGEGAVLEHAFPVINRGNKVLEIKNVNPG